MIICEDSTTKNFVSDHVGDGVVDGDGGGDGDGDIDFSQRWRWAGGGGGKSVNFFSLHISRWTLAHRASSSSQFD